MTGAGGVKIMKCIVLTIASMLCVTRLFAQWSGNTTYHYGANGAPAGRSVTTQFGNQTTTTHYDQSGRSAGTTRNNVVGR